MTGVARPATGLLDTSAVIALPQLSDAAELPLRPLITTVTLAELSVGPLVATDPSERARRQAVLQQAEADFDPLPFDVAAEYTMTGCPPRGCCKMKQSTP